MLPMQGNPEEGRQNERMKSKVDWEIIRRNIETKSNMKGD